MPRAGGDKSSDARRGSDRCQEAAVTHGTAAPTREDAASRSHQSPPSHPRGIAQVPWEVGVSPAPARCHPSSSGQQHHLRAAGDTSAPPRWHPATRPAAGCLDFSQGKFGKCQNRNLLTNSGGVSIRAQPCDQVETLFTAVLGGKVVFFFFFFKVRMCFLLEMFVIL